MWSFLVHPNCYKKTLLFFSPNIRMTGKNVIFGDKITKKSDFYENKKVTKIDEIDVNQILISKEEPYVTKNYFKYFIWILYTTTKYGKKLKNFWEYNLIVNLFTVTMINT